MKFTVTDQQVIATKYSVADDQTILGILKKMGAPILGNFYLSTDPTYVVSMWTDAIPRSTTYQFILRDLVSQDMKDLHIQI